MTVLVLEKSGFPNVDITRASENMSLLIAEMLWLGGRDLLASSMLQNIFNVVKVCAMLSIHRLDIQFLSVSNVGIPHPSSDIAP
jgi:hypothetical protein